MLVISDSEFKTSPRGVRHAGGPTVWKDAEGRWISSFLLIISSTHSPAPGSPWSGTDLDKEEQSLLLCGFNYGPTPLSLSEKGIQMLTLLVTLSWFLLLLL